MTDREKLIEILENTESAIYWNSEDKGFIQKIADHLLTNGVTFAKDTNVPSWIPVSERLPEDDLPKDSKSKQIKVLVAYMVNGYWVIRTNLRKKGKRHRRPDEWAWSVSAPITHWMLLPEPPKEE